MRIFALLIAFFWTFLAFAESTSSPAARTWITDVTIVSPENLDHIGEGNVLIENGRIVSVDRKRNDKKPAGATVILRKRAVLDSWAH